MSRSRTSVIAVWASSIEISVRRAAFHKAFASSTQNKSGTRNRISSRRYDDNSSSACATNGSRWERHHFTATLASTTTRLTVRDPRESSPRPTERALERVAAVASAEPILQKLYRGVSVPPQSECSLPKAKLLQRQSTSGSRERACGEPCKFRRERFPRKALP